MSDAFSARSGSGVHAEPAFSQRNPSTQFARLCLQSMTTPSGLATAPVFPSLVCVVSYYWHRRGLAKREIGASLGLLPLAPTQHHYAFPTMPCPDYRRRAIPWTRSHALQPSLQCCRSRHRHPPHLHRPDDTLPDHCRHAVPGTRGKPLAIQPTTGATACNPFYRCSPLIVSHTILSCPFAFHQD